MNSWKVILATIVIFGAGVLTGGLLVHKTTNVKKVRPAAATNAPAQTQRLDFLVRASRELELNSEQRERIERVLSEGQESTRQIWETVAPEMRKELQLVRQRIKAELTPEQRRRFEELTKRPTRPSPRAGNTNNPAPPVPVDPR